MYPGLKSLKILDVTKHDQDWFIWIKLEIWLIFEECLYLSKLFNVGDDMMKQYSTENVNL